MPILYIETDKVLDNITRIPKQMKDKELTKRKLIDAVGIIIRSKGFKAILISQVAREAGVDRKLVYRYFGNINNLIEAYITENDYWLLFSEHLRHLSGEMEATNSQAIITTILQEMFKFFYAEKATQHLILMELSGSTPMMRSIHNARESLGQEIFEMVDNHFQKSEVNFRAVAALLVGGIYYMILHTRNNGYNFTDIDLKTERGTNEILQTIAKIVDWAFAAAAI